MNPVELPSHCGKCDSREECVHLLEWQGTVQGTPAEVAWRMNEFLTPLGYQRVEGQPYPTWQRGSEWWLGLVPHRSPVQVNALLTARGNLTHLHLQFVYKDADVMYDSVVLAKSLFAEELRALILFLQTGYSRVDELRQIHHRLANALPTAISVYAVLTFFLFVLVKILEILVIPGIWIIKVLVAGVIVALITLFLTRPLYFRFLSARAGLRYDARSFAEFEPMLAGKPADA